MVDSEAERLAKHVSYARRASAAQLVDVASLSGRSSDVPPAAIMAARVGQKFAPSALTGQMPVDCEMPGLV